MNLVILSSAYVSDEMRLEFGEIPPCMLPLGGKLLLEHQVEAFEGYKIYLTLPHDYLLTRTESEVVANLNLKVINLDHKFSLGEAVSQALQSIDVCEDITVLFGDTLVNPYESLSNTIGVSRSFGYYQWSVYNKVHNTFSNNGYQSHENEVFIGYFTCTEKMIFIAALDLSGKDFIKSLNLLLSEQQMNICQVKSWFDFGHLNTYYASKKGFTTERSFNELRCEDDFLLKSSTNKLKIDSEIFWFQNLPRDLHIFCPVIVPLPKNHVYKIEYLNNLTLTEIYLYGRVQAVVWKQILRSCFDFLDKRGCHSYEESELDWNVVGKVIQRWDIIPVNAKNKLVACMDVLGTSIEEVLDYISPYLEVHKNEQNFLIHGDFCFSNIFYDFRSNRIKVIDPRGCDFGGKPCMTGPENYDVAKLAHSIIGRYDEIVAARYDLSLLNDQYQLEFYDVDRNYGIKNEFISLVYERNIPIKSIYAQMIGLFCSMIPLHGECEDRQLAFLVNAIRLKDEMRLL